LIEVEEIMGPGFLIFFQTPDNKIFDGSGITPYFYEQQWAADERHKRERKQEAARRRRLARKALKDNDWQTLVAQARASLAAKRARVTTTPDPIVLPAPKPATRINAFHDKMARQEDVKAQRVAKIHADDDDTLTILMAAIRVLYNG